MPRRYRLSLPLWCPAGGRAPALPVRRALAAPCGGRSGFGRLLTLPLWFPAGGVPSLLPAAPAFSLFSFPLSPSPPSPAGKGGLRLFSCKGLRPLHPQHLTAYGTYRACQAGTRRGACPLCRPPTLPLVYFPAPYPPSPLPRRGRGGLRLFSCKGLRPLHPRH